MSESPPPSRRPPSKEEEPLEALPAEVHEPVVTKAPPSGRKFPCSQCGAKLDFDPAAQALKCPYCGHVQEIAAPVGEVEERDFETYLRKFADGETVIAGRSSQVRCTGCGAVVLLEDKVATDKCPFCATHLESEPEAAQGMIAPEGLLPFSIPYRQALEAFNRWIGSLWFAPNALKKLANLGQLSGVYIPFWTYDSMTYTNYAGERGDDYQVTETYTDYVTNASGNRSAVTKTRTVTKTRWHSVSGQVRHFFDDVLICGSESLTANEVIQLSPWDLDQLEEFKADFLSGFKTERYAIGLEDGFERARQIMDNHIHSLCLQDIGGDHQRLHSVRTRHVGVTFKHLLLPAWLGTYRFRDQPYRVIVNGRTGRVSGSRPYSWVKIALLILAILLIVAALIGGLAFFGVFGGSSQDGRSDVHPPAAPTQHAQLVAGPESPNYVSLASGSTGGGRISPV